MYIHETPDPILIILAPTSLILVDCEPQARGGCDRGFFAGRDVGSSLNWGPIRGSFFNEGALLVSGPEKMCYFRELSMSSVAGLTFGSAVGATAA